MTKTVTFCYDFGSPYSYLAHRNLKAITETGAEIDFKPVLVGGIFKSTDNRPPLSVPKKFTYMATDMMRWSKKLNVEIKMNPYFPIVTVLICVELFWRRKKACWINIMKKCLKLFGLKLLI